MTLGVRLMTLGVGSRRSFGDEFGGDFDEFDEFGGRFLVCSLTSGVHLMSLAVRLMSLGVRLQRELGDEFGVEFAEFDDFGGWL